jgi:hypothetical protein
MDTHPTGDLNNLERRLFELRPAGDGLDADQMLFVAGQNSVRRSLGRIAWPIVSGCLVLVVTALTVGFLQERSARLELVAQIHQQSPTSAPAFVSPANGEAPSAEPPNSSSYLAARRALRENLDAWPPSPIGESTDGPPPSTRTVLSARSPGEFLDQ